MNEELKEDVVIDDFAGFEDEEVTDTPDDDFDNTGLEEESTNEDSAEKEVEEELEPIEESEEAVENTNETEETEDTMMLKYNHEEKDYKISEVKELAQKGMNYDKMVEKVNNLENSPELEFVRQQAKANDMSVTEYIQATHDYQKQIEVDKLVEAGNTEEVARELIDKRYAEKQAKIDKEKADNEQLSKDAESKELNEFLETFPEIIVDEIPSEVFVLAKEKSISLTDAMYRIKSLKQEKEIKALKQKQENKTKAPLTKGVSEYGVEQDKKIDPDLDGWDDTDY